MLLKFSDMLSHQLYEGNKDYIPLDEELNHLENYIELEKVRKEDTLEIAWKVEGDTSKHMIGPMIFLTFLENAFKHGYKADSPQVISGCITASAHEIVFDLENNYGFESKEGDSKKGVGLENTARRLALLYPGNHSLDITQNDGFFKVRLIINP